nr:hypothetical protein [Endozoicomonas elysicola]
MKSPISEYNKRLSSKGLLAPTAFEAPRMPPGSHGLNTLPLEWFFTALTKIHDLP